MCICIFNINARKLDGHYRSWIEYLNERYKVYILGRSIKFDNKNMLFTSQQRNDSDSTQNSTATVFGQQYTISCGLSNSVDYILLILYILFNKLSGMFNERAIRDSECIHISNLQICSPFIVCEFSFKFNHTHTRTHARTHISANAYKRMRIATIMYRYGRINSTQ